MALPILKVKDELLRRIEQEQCLIITGDTGSGKSTQIPQFLYNSGYRRIAITQPRRVAAVSLATRVSTEMAVKLGQKVGYTVRFDDCSSDNTELKYLTDGCLLRECIADRNFSRYDVIILDEAHERSLQTDILFGLLFETLRRRPISHGKKGLRVIVTSATLDTKKFCEYFNCRSFHIPGRCFPVEIRNSDEAPRRYVAAAVDTVLAIHRKSAADGHVLVFLTGREEIEDACEMLGRKVDALIDENVDLPDIVILPGIFICPSNRYKNLAKK
ncbi:DEAH-box ATP-dependent RNA helicase prp22 [Bonamia ostreae]|uniref:DEAH-box ATP-dependent RNA helicase prp22 n=1 Tax=Bonamia ostreae TaxID=126728 RepID=A0ABV2AGS7_9EUKA